MVVAFYLLIVGWWLIAFLMSVVRCYFFGYRCLLVCSLLCVVCCVLCVVCCCKFVLGDYFLVFGSRLLAMSLWWLVLRSLLLDACSWVLLVA